MKKLLLLCLIIHLAFGTNENRRRLAPDASIINEIQQQLDQGIEHPRFSINAILGGENLFTDDSELFEVDVVLTNPSVSDLTTFSIDGFNRPVNAPLKLLVADHSRQQSGFAILAVNEKKKSVSGIVQKDNLFVKLEQRSNGRTVATQITFDPDEEWECMLNKYGVDHIHDHHDVHVEDTLKHMHSGRDGHNIRQLLDMGFENRKLYATDTFPNAWSYQVDLFIEVDDAFVQNHDTDTINMPNTIDYVNALVTAVSVRSMSRFIYLCSLISITDYLRQLVLS